MPTYELTCEDCGERFDVFVMRLLRDEDKVCPACGSHTVKRGFGGGVLGKGTATVASPVSSSCASGGFT